MADMAFKRSAVRSRLSPPSGTILREKSPETQGFLFLPSSRSDCRFSPSGQSFPAPCDTPAHKPGEVAAYCPHSLRAGRSADNAPLKAARNKLCNG